MRLTKPELSFSMPAGVRPVLQMHFIEHAPKALSGFKIGFATDFHYRPGMCAEAWVDALQREAPDVMLYGGDLSDTREGAVALLGYFQKLRPPFGSFAVYGNNDAEAFPKVREYERTLRRYGITLLCDSYCDLKIRSAVLRIGGVQELFYHAPKPERAFLRANCDYLVGLAHYPSLSGIRKESAPDLMLCGHTHGGQFNFLGLTPFSFGFESRIKGGALRPTAICGLHRFGDTTMLVSKGIGMSRIPLRIGVRSEMHIITFRP